MKQEIKQKDSEFKFFEKNIRRQLAFSKGQWKGNAWKKRRGQKESKGEKLKNAQIKGVFLHF